MRKGPCVNCPQSPSWCFVSKGRSAGRCCRCPGTGGGTTQGVSTPQCPVGTAAAGKAGLGFGEESQQRT